MLVELEQKHVQVTQLLLNVYQDMVNHQLVHVTNVESEQVHVLFQELLLPQLLVSHHSKMYQQEHVHVLQDQLHLLMEHPVYLVHLIVLHVHQQPNVLHVLLHLYWTLLLELVHLTVLLTNISELQLQQHLTQPQWEFYNQVVKIVQVLVLLVQVQLFV